MGKADFVASVEPGKLRDLLSAGIEVETSEGPGIAVNVWVADGVPARLVFTPAKGGFAELWDPSAGTWDKGADVGALIAESMRAPRPSPEKLASLGLGPDLKPLSAAPKPTPIPG